MSALLKEDYMPKVKRGVLPLPPGMYHSNLTAILLGISEPTLWRYQKDKKIESTIHAGLRVFSEEAIINCLQKVSGFKIKEAKAFVEANKSKLPDPLKDNKK